MALRLIIDGYNITRRRPAAGVTDMDAEKETLISRLQVYKKARRVKVTVVFDASTTVGLTSREENHGGVKVVFTAAAQEADTLIKDMARTHREGATVVTSDREVAGYARNVGAVVFSAEEFEDLLDAAIFEEMKGAAPEDDEDFDAEARTSGRKKGPSKRPPRDERKKKNRKKKL